MALGRAVLYLNLLLDVVEDEPLGVDEVVRGVEGDGVQGPAVDAAPLHRPASRFGPNQPFDWRHKCLWAERRGEPDHVTNQEPSESSCSFRPGRMKEFLERHHEDIGLRPSPLLSSRLRMFCSLISMKAGHLETKGSWVSQVPSRAAEADSRDPECPCSGE